MENALMVSNAILWVVVLALVLVVFALARQIGILYERVAPMGALTIDTGPQVGEAAPAGGDGEAGQAQQRATQHAGGDDERRGRRGPYPVSDDAFEAVLDLLVVEDLQRALEGVAQRCAGPVGVLGDRQPGAEPPSDTCLGQSFAEDLLSQEVVLDELAETAPDLVFALRDDRRVWDREPERVPEQRRHGEPVGECTDHRRRGEGADVADPAVPPVHVRPHEHGGSDE